MRTTMIIVYTTSIIVYIVSKYLYLSTSGRSHTERVEESGGLRRETPSLTKKNQFFLRCLNEVMGKNKISHLVIYI